jgi:hypothetical protein
MSHGLIHGKRKTLMQIRFQASSRIAALASVLVLTACGGGSGARTGSVAETPAAVSQAAAATETVQQLGRHRHRQLPAPVNQTPFAVAALKGESVMQIATVPTATYYIPNAGFLYNVPRTEIVIRSAVRLL